VGKHLLDRFMDFEAPKPKVAWDKKERRWKLAPGARWDQALLPVIQNLAAQGCTESDIGMILGADPERAKGVVTRLKKNHKDVRQAWEAGVRMANVQLVAQMFRSAVGYEYVDVDEEYKCVQDPADPTKTKEILVGKKVRKRTQPANAALAMFLAANRMPDQFVDKKVLEQRSIEMKLDKIPTKAQIQSLAGKLSSIKEERKIVESEVIES